MATATATCLVSACAGRVGPWADPGPRTGPDACGASGIALQVLGSGGPIADDARASAGYLLWRDGRAVALVDAGGGTFARFGAAGASVSVLQVIAISHLHVDHVADLLPILKGAYFEPRHAPLPVIGPDGHGRFPGLVEFLTTLLDPERGAYRYLAWLLESGGGAQLVPREVEHRRRTPVSVYRARGFELFAVGVHHGPVPALAFRAEFTGAGTPSRTIVFAGDQSGNNPHFADFARDADLLVMHHAIGPDAGPGALTLHATPAKIAEVAREAGASRLVLAHHMQRALQQRSLAEAQISRGYEGPVVFAGDLDCLPLP